MQNRLNMGGCFSNVPTQLALGSDDLYRLLVALITISNDPRFEGLEAIPLSPTSMSEGDGPSFTESNLLEQYRSINEIAPEVLSQLSLDAPALNRAHLYLDQRSNLRLVILKLEGSYTNRAIANGIGLLLTGGVTKGFLMGLIGPRGYIRSP